MFAEDLWKVNVRMRNQFWDSLSPGVTRQTGLAAVPYQEWEICETIPSDVGIPDRYCGDKIKHDSGPAPLLRDSWLTRKLERLCSCTSFVGDGQIPKKELINIWLLNTTLAHQLL